MGNNKANLAANFAGRGWTALLSIALVPLYLRYLGLEGYGLIGFFITLQAAVGLVDFGLTTSVNRELARRSIEPESAASTRDLVRTLEIGYFAIGLSTGVLIALAAPFVAAHWINKTAVISPASVTRSVRLMGLVFACQWPISFYGGGLLGLQHQVLLNSINVVSATLKGIGAILILKFVSPTVEAFLWWQAIVSLAQAYCVRYALWHMLPLRDHKARFTLSSITQIWAFASSLAAMAAISLFLQQMDKIVLSAIVPLGLFGYYVLASTLSGAISIPAAPVGDTLFPIYARLVRQNKRAELVRQYHRGCQMIASLVFPVASVLAWFSSPLIYAWTGSHDTAAGVARVTSMLVLGTALSVPMTTLDHLQMAYGWLGPAIRVRLIGAVILLSSLYFFVPIYGIIGGAYAWICVNVAYTIIAPRFVFRKLIPEERTRWLWQDTIVPFVAAVSIGGVLRLIILEPSRPMILIQLVVYTLVTLLGTAATTPNGRQMIRQLSVLYHSRFSKSAEGA
ncbi:MAG: lipopolysaccharide biosynthesis protein [Gemmatimonadaceae bacterium]